MKCFLVQAFKQKYNLPYTLLSDEGNKLRKEFGVPADFFGALAGRQTYVVNRQGIISLVYNNQFQPEKHVDETLKILQTWGSMNFHVSILLREFRSPQVEDHVWKLWKQIYLVEDKSRK